MTILSVNLNKIAVLRNSRGEHEPSLLRAAACVIDAGARGITLHPRPDQRHVRPDDVRRIGEFLASMPGIELNIEGNGFASARGDHPGLLRLVQECGATQCTLVPDGDAQITSDHGFNLIADAPRLRSLIKELRDGGARVSLFIDAGCEHVEIAADLGAQRVELYTGPYAKAYAAGDADVALRLCIETARRAREAGISVNAGHDLNQDNLPRLLAAIPWIAEVSIGHALIGEALYDGLERTVRNYQEIVAAPSR
ncbi:MAG: pyridoxine 5'-phosphate synthase [Tahibacter sp.]